jgi:hypothetical protein
MEKDYRSYGLDFMRPQEIERRGVRVNLPVKIYQNVAQLFQVFLDKLLADVINQPEMESNSEHIEHLLRLLLFSKLFNDDVTVANSYRPGHGGQQSEGSLLTSA